MGLATHAKGSELGRSDAKVAKLKRAALIAPAARPKWHLYAQGRHPVPVDFKLFHTQQPASCTAGILPLVLRPKMARLKAASAIEMSICNYAS